MTLTGEQIELFLGGDSRILNYWASPSACLWGKMYYDETGVDDFGIMVPATWWVYGY